MGLQDEYELRETSSASSEQDTGEKERKYMKKQIQYSNEPIGEVRILNDFLPSPEELAFKEKKVKVTMTLSQASVDFFKAEAKKHHTSYQAMIRQLLDIYANQQRPWSQFMEMDASGSGSKTTLWC